MLWTEQRANARIFLFWGCAGGFRPRSLRHRRGGDGGIRLGVRVMEGESSDATPTPFHTEPLALEHFLKERRVLVLWTKN